MFKCYYKILFTKKITNQNDAKGKDKISIPSKIHTQSYYV